MKRWSKNLLASAAALGVLTAFVALTGPVEDQYSRSSFNLSGKSSTEAVFLEGGERLASLDLEVADSPEERKTGLMNRTSLEAGSGMVFVWNSSSERAFWMKNTYIPLDMIFISGNGTVLNLEEADPQPNASIQELEVYRSEGEAMYVIETHQNFSERNGVEKGSRVVFR